MKLFTLFAASATLAAAEEGCPKGKKPAKKGSFLRVANVPNVGRDLKAAKAAYEGGQALMSGFSKVKCLNEGMVRDADLHENPNAYKAVDGVSVVKYESMVDREFRDAMTPQVCFNFCKTQKDMRFFGLLNGRECYCTPYYKAKAGGEDSICDAPCDGDSAQTCGGKHKSQMYEMHNCA